MVATLVGSLAEGVLVVIVATTEGVSTMGVPVVVATTTIGDFQGLRMYMIFLGLVFVLRV